MGFDEGEATSSDSGKALLLKLVRQKETFIATTSVSKIFTDRLAASLEIVTPSVIVEGLTVEYINSLNDILTLKSDVVFLGRPYFTTDTAGFALIKQGTRSVEITFEREYLEQPIVNAAIAFEAASSTPSELVEGSEESILADDIHYVITKKSATGFTILLNHKAPFNVPFSWIALTVKNPKIFNAPVQSYEQVVPAASLDIPGDGGIPEPSSEQEIQTPSISEPPINSSPDQLSPEQSTPQDPASENTSLNTPVEEIIPETL